MQSDTWAARTWMDELPSRKQWDRDGNPIRFRAWGKLRQDDTYCRIGYDELSLTVAVITTWMGVNLRPSAHNADMAPFIFQTQIFGGRYDLESTAYPTETAARTGHRTAVTNLRENQPPW